MKTVARWVARAAALWLACGLAPSLAASYTEDAVKAAFLHRFGAYVEWPPGAPADAPFVIGVIGADGVAQQLERLLPGLTIQNRPARVRRLRDPRDVDGVHILYLGAEGLKRVRAMLGSTATRPVLIVTDRDNITAGTSVINFIRERENVRFEVSLSAAERRGLKINAGLLSVAARVEGGPRADSRCGDYTFVVTRLAGCLHQMAIQFAERTLVATRVGSGSEA